MRVFSARGCAPPVREAARIFATARRVPVDVLVCGQSCASGSCGPATAHRGFFDEVAAGRFDVAVAGAESDMDELHMAGLLHDGSRASLGLREAAILVPRSRAGVIGELRDLARPGVRIAISVIDCLRGVWEDVCGRAGCIEEVRRNIAVRATGCMGLVRAVVEARVDAAIGWSSFATFHSNIAAVPLPPEARVRRSVAAAVMRDAADPAGGRALVEFLASAAAAPIYARHGFVERDRAPATVAA